MEERGDRTAGGGVSLFCRGSVSVLEEAKDEPDTERRMPSGSGGGGIKVERRNARTASGVYGIRPVISRFCGRRRLSSVKT